MLQRVKVLIKIFVRQVHRRHHNYHHHHRSTLAPHCSYPKINTMSFKCSVLHRWVHQKLCAIPQNRTTFMNTRPVVSDPSGRAVYGVGLGPLACWDCGFECRCDDECLSLVSVVLSGRKFCDGLFSRPEESYRMWYVWVWSWNLDSEEALAHKGLSHHAGKIQQLRFALRENWSDINPKLAWVS